MWRWYTYTWRDNSWISIDEKPQERRRNRIGDYFVFSRLDNNVLAINFTLLLLTGREYCWCQKPQFPANPWPCTAVWGFSAWIRCRKRRLCSPLCTKLCWIHHCHVWNYELWSSGCSMQSKIQWRYCDSTVSYLSVSWEFIVKANFIDNNISSLSLLLLDYGLVTMQMEIIIAYDFALVFVQVHWCHRRSPLTLTWDLLMHGNFQFFTKMCCITPLKYPNKEAGQIYFYVFVLIQLRIK